MYCTYINLLSIINLIHGPVSRYILTSTQENYHTCLLVKRMFCVRSRVVGVDVGWDAFAGTWDSGVPVCAGINQQRGVSVPPTPNGRSLFCPRPCPRSDHGVYNNYTSVLCSCFSRTENIFLVLRPCLSGT